MCGIHGVISSKTGYNKSLCDFISQAFVANSLRGMDSSGMFQIGTTKSAVYLHKDAVHGTDFIKQNKAEALIRDVDSSMFTVCHVRAKTQGDVIAENAHPFVGWADDGNRIIGVHNGSLTNWKHKESAKGYDVDSDWAIQQIAERGHQAIADLNGAYAFVYWDEEAPKKINFVRNNERPMHFLFSKDGKHMMFASEARMLVWLAERVRFQSDGKVRELPVGTVVTFDVSKDKIEWETTKLPASTTSSYTTSHTYSGYSYQSSSNPSDMIDPPHMIKNMADRWQNYLKNGGNVVVTPLSLVDNEDKKGVSCGGDTSSTTNFQGGFVDVIPDFKFPENLIPPRQHLKVTDEEMMNARIANFYGGLINVEWDMVTGNGKDKCLMGRHLCPNTGEEFDVIMREVSNNFAKKLYNRDTDAVIIGAEADGTLVVNKMTKRMLALASS